MAYLEPEVKLRLITLADDMVKATFPACDRAEATLLQYTEWFDKAYKAVAKTVFTVATE